ncbi:MAG TPA: MerR family transcriptional regulator [Acidobacteriota bacterium]|nr:MerR family transcriptional regulator [Acidobacteriota bacterium]
MDLTVGKLAKKAGVNLQTVRYYEKRKLIPPAKRTPSGYRLYSPDVVRRILFIKRAQELGFSLREIHELLNLRRTSSNTCLQVRQRAELKIHEIEKKIDSLKRVKTAQSQLRAQCNDNISRNSSSECPLLDALEHF